MKLETQMTAGFTSLDKRLTLMCDMFVKDREDRLARQLERDKRNATDQTTNPRARRPPPLLKLYNGTQEYSTDPDWKNLKATYDTTTHILSCSAKPTGKMNT